MISTPPSTKQKIKERNIELFWIFNFIFYDVNSDVHNHQ